MAWGRAGPCGPIRAGGGFYVALPVYAGAIKGDGRRPPCSYWVVGGCVDPATSGVQTGALPTEPPDREVHPDQGAGGNDGIRIDIEVEPRGRSSTTTYY